ncbi:MAG TPA: LacI family DNA-binding transcriptional regulator [Victivallales bacterium]|nr:LacI family DNA-binding transcriptional regulator [Victivallales bacterium]HPO91402.1 LacI family DNA-binding transcriptional regulator [Victivallales bacterium]HRR06237.1 LacI family DNA-binding transcriptional regulator [Victivallales bacterium]HRU02241.1 LacI family DNA-binding transcriptional regulator [Victivallales bacterium]
MISNDKITLSTLAKYAGVTTKTAGKVLRGEKSVRPYIRENVLKIARKYNYRPNLLAQALKKKTLNLISFHITQLNIPFFGVLFETISTLLGEKGYIVAACNGIHSINETNHMLFACATIMVSPEKSKVKEVVQRGALVTIDAYSPDIRFASDISLSFKEAYKALTIELIESKKSKITFFSYPEDKECFNVNYRKKFKYIEETLSKNKLKLVIPPSGAFFSNPATLAKFINDNPDEINAVCCNNDYAAISLINELRILNIRVPEDITVVGCDGIQLVKGLWTLSYNVSDIAEKVFLLLEKQFKNKTKENIKVLPELLKI